MTRKETLSFGLGVLAIAIVGLMVYGYYSMTRRQQENAVMSVSWELAGDGIVQGSVLKKSGEPFIGRVGICTVDGWNMMEVDRNGHFEERGMGEARSIEEVEVEGVGKLAFPLTIDGSGGVRFTIRLK